MAMKPHRKKIIEQDRKTLQQLTKQELATIQPGEIHTITTLTGSGKTTIFIDEIKEIKKSDHRIFWLSARHNLAEENQHHFDLYLKGRDHYDCQYEDEFNKLKNIHGFNPEQNICGTCEHQHTCEYRENLRRLSDKNTKLVIGVHSHINTKIPLEFLGKDDILIIDESISSELYDTIHITLDKLQDMLILCGGDKDFYLFYKRLKEIIISKDEYYGKSFIDALNLDDLNLNWRRWFFVSYKINKGLYEIDMIPYSNYLKELKEIVTLANKYKDRENVALPFAKPLIWTGYDNQPGKEIRYIDVKHPIPSNYPIIILDATGGKEKQLLDSFFNEHTITEKSIDGFVIENIPYQITDNNYSRKSMSNPATLDRIVKGIYQQIKESNGAKVGIITMQKFEHRIINKLKRLLTKNNLNYILESAHYYDVAGLNKFHGFNYLFVIGSPEPRPFEARLITEAIHVGEPSVSIERKDGIYSDERLQRFIESTRESQLVQSVGRGRELLDDDIKVFILTCLNIPLNTKDVNMDMLLNKPTKPVEVALSFLYEYGENNWIKRSDYVNRLRHHAPFTTDPKLTTKTLKFMKRMHYIHTKPNYVKLSMLGNKRKNDIGVFKV